MAGMNKLKEFKAGMKLWETELDALCFCVLFFLFMCITNKPAPLLKIGCPIVVC